MRLGSGLMAIASVPVTATAALGDPEVAGPRDEPQPLVIAGEQGEQFTDEHPYRALPYDPWHGGVALGVAFGMMRVEDVDTGFYGRLELGGYDIQTRRRGFIVGSLVGVEGWGAAQDDDTTSWGASLPWIVYAGLQSDALFFALGAGFEVAVLDRIDGELGIGPFAPVGAGYLGVDLEGVRFLIDSRVDYRWQFGAEDRAALRLGLAVQLTTD